MYCVAMIVLPARHVSTAAAGISSAVRVVKALVDADDDLDGFIGQSVSQPASPSFFFLSQLLAPAQTIHSLTRVIAVHHAIRHL